MFFLRKSLAPRKIIIPSLSSPCVAKKSPFDYGGSLHSNRFVINKTGSGGSHAAQERIVFDSKNRPQSEDSYYKHRIDMHIHTRGENNKKPRLSDTIPYAEVYTDGTFRILPPDAPPANSLGAKAGLSAKDNKDLYERFGDHFSSPRIPEEALTTFLPVEDADFLRRRWVDFRYTEAVDKQDEQMWRDSKSHFRQQKRLIDMFGGVEGAVQEALLPKHATFRKELIKRPLDRRVLEEIYKDFHGKRVERVLKKNVQWERWVARGDVTNAPVFSASRRAQKVFGSGGVVRELARAASAAQFPDTSLPEVAFVGRTNSGRSALINAVVNSFVCEYGYLKGTTTTANFYSVANSIILVDLPGYGYFHPAQVDPLTARHGHGLVQTYLDVCATRSAIPRNLKRIFVCVLAATGLEDGDLAICNECERLGLNFSVLLTKTDVVSVLRLARIVDLTRARLLSFNHCKELMMVNSLRFAGVHRLQNFLAQLALPEEQSTNDSLDGVDFDSIM